MGSISALDFPAQRAHWIGANFRKKPCLFQEIKNIIQAVMFFFCLFFFVAFINF